MTIHTTTGALPETTKHPLERPLPETAKFTTTGALPETHEAPAREAAPAPRPALMSARPAARRTMHSIRLLRNGSTAPRGALTVRFREPTMFESGSFLRTAEQDFEAERFPADAARELLSATVVEPSPAAFGALLSQHSELLQSIAEAVAFARSEGVEPAGDLTLSVSIRGKAA